MFRAEVVVIDLNEGEDSCKVMTAAASSREEEEANKE
jgi:hypothetical protein